MNLPQRSFVLCCGIAATTLALVHPAKAASFTIHDGQTVGLQVLNPGEVGKVEQGGAIFVANGHGAILLGDATIDNAGTITGTDFGNAGIVGNSGNMITNSGTATGGSVGILTANDNTIINSGTAAGGSRGILVGDGNRIVNSGTATGGLAGIVTNNGNMITNSGMATGGNYGIAAGNSSTITSSGTATGGINGIVVNDGNTITNSGIATGGDTGISVANGNTITNSGKIIGGVNAVSLVGNNNTLTLLAGSNIQGNLDLGDASNSLIIGRGLDTALAFTGTPSINTSGLPFVIADGTLYVVNVTSFSVQDEMTNDLTRAVAGAVEGRLASTRLTGGGGNSMGMAMNGTMISAAADITPAAPESGVWLSALGSYRDQGSHGDVGDFETLLGGTVGGIDGRIADNTRAGVFAGLAFGSLNADKSPQDLDSDNYFGGLYLGHDMGSSFIDLSVTAGWSEFHSDREVANNMVAGGIEHAKADYGGFLISPSVKLGTHIEMGPGTFTPSVRLRYAGLFLESYKEHGSAADLAVDDRDINIFDVRGELAYSFAARETSDGSLYQTVRLGVDGTFSDVGRVEASLAGQALDFDVSDDDVARGFIGYDAVFAASNGVSFKLATEAGYDTSDAFTLEGHAEVAWAF